MSLWLMDDEQKEREGYAIVAIELVFAVCSRRRRLMLSFAYLFLLLPSNVLCCDRSSFSSFSSLVQIGRSFFYDDDVPDRTLLLLPYCNFVSRI